MSDMSTTFTGVPNAQVAPATARPEPWFPVKALANTLVLSAIASAVLAVVVLVVFDGWTYYRTPMTVRGYLPAHRLLRPSGLIGQTLGIVGLALMLVPVLYAARKKVKRLSRFGSMKTWLEVHIFCGIVGPVFITFHTAFKFNGAVSVAYWMMVLVAGSGFVGRYLYVRIPRTMRGTELTLAELQQRADELKQELESKRVPPWLLARVAELEAQSKPSTRAGAWVVSLFAGDLTLRVRLWRLRRVLRAHDVNASRARELTALVSERATLLLRLWLLDRTKRLFTVWHVFHQPLVGFLLLIVAVHIAVVTYLGYTVFSRWILS